MLKWKRLPLCQISLPIPSSWLPQGAATHSLQLRAQDSAAQPCPHAGICSHHLEGSKIKGSCLILLQSSLSISIGVSSVSERSLNLPLENIPV